MCGRFALQTIPRSLLIALGLTLPDMKPRFNIAPTQTVPVIVQENNDAPAIQFMRWGLIPSWAKDESAGARAINARGETVDSKPTFRESFKRRRCLVPATGFYEWKRGASAKDKIPYYFTSATGDGLAFTGLWDSWKDIQSFTIITTTANATMSPIHDRMPVILESEKWSDWLDGSANEAKAFLQPASDDCLLAWEASRHVNNPRNDDESCTKPVL